MTTRAIAGIIYNHRILENERHVSDLKKFCICISVARPASKLLIVGLNEAAETKILLDDDWIGDSRVIFVIYKL